MQVLFLGLLGKSASTSSGDAGRADAQAAEFADTDEGFAGKGLGCAEARRERSPQKGACVFADPKKEVVRTSRLAIWTVRRCEPNQWRRPSSLSEQGEDPCTYQSGMRSCESRREKQWCCLSGWALRLRYKSHDTQDAGRLKAAAGKSCRAGRECHNVGRSPRRGVGGSALSCTIEDPTGCLRERVDCPLPWWPSLVCDRIL